MNEPPGNPAARNINAILTRLKTLIRIRKMRRTASYILNPLLIIEITASFSGTMPMMIAPFAT